VGLPIASIIDTAIIVPTISWFLRETRRRYAAPEYMEAFEKCSILFKAKEGENFNHPREIGFAFHGSGIH